jgi:hypothetical protein
MNQNGEAGIDLFHIMSYNTLVSVGIVRRVQCLFLEVS